MPLVSQLVPILGGRVQVGFVRHDSNRPVLLGIGGDPVEGRLIQNNGRGPKLERTPHPRQNRDEDDRHNEQPRDLDAIRTFDDVDDRRVGEDDSDHSEGDHPDPLSLTRSSQGDGDGGRRHQDQHSRRVCARLLVDVRIEYQRDEKGDERENKHEGPDRAGPQRGHPVARQVARHQVQQARERARTGEPQDRDGREVVEGTEPRAEETVREEGQRAAVRGSRELSGCDQDRCDEAGCEQEEAHDARRSRQQPARSTNAARRVIVGV